MSEFYTNALLSGQGEARWRLDKENNPLFTGRVNSPRTLDKSRAIVMEALKDSPATMDVFDPDNTSGREQLVVWAGGTSYEFQLLYAGEGWPSDVQALLKDLPGEWPRHLVVTARRFSDGALKLLRDRGANWIDSAGHVRIEAPPALLIERSPAPIRLSPSREFKWSRSSVDLVEYLLATATTRIRVHLLAKETGWSAGQVASVLRQFDRMNWTRRHGPPRGRGAWRELANPGAVLEAWTEHLSKQSFPIRMGHALMRDPLAYAHQILQPVLEKESKWALTGWPAAQLLAPYSTIVPTLSLYVPESFLYDHHLRGFADSASIRLLEEGGNIEFRGANHPDLFKHVQLKGLPLASTPRVYADLIALGGRAEDVAQHVRETLLGY